MESQGKSKYEGAKVNKDAEKSLNCCTQSIQQFKTFSACFTRRLFVSSLLNLFCRPCFYCSCKRLKAYIGISHEQISQEI